MNKFQITLLLIVSSIIFMGSSQEAMAIEIDFESYEDNGNPVNFLAGEIVNTQLATQIPGAPEGLGVSIFVDNFNEGGTQTSDVNTNPTQFLVDYLDLDQLVSTDIGVIFDSDNPTGGDLDLGGFPAGTTGIFISDFGEGTNDPGLFLIIEEDPEDNCNPFPIVPSSTCLPDDEGSLGGQFIFRFTDPVAVLSIDVYDIEPGESDPTDILMYDENDEFLGQFSTDDVLTTGGDFRWRNIPLNSIGVKTMIVEWPGSGAIDNIVIGIPVDGEILTIDTTTLLVAGLPSMTIWMASVLAGATGVTAFYLKSRKN